MSDEKKSRPRSEPRLTRKIKLFLWVFLLGALVSGAVYLIWFTPAFQIQAIEVNGGTPPQQEVVKNATKGNMLFWKPPVNEKDYPQLAKVEVKRNFFERKITVNLEERQKEIIWCLEKREQCFWVDKTGFAFTPAPFTQGTLIEVKVIRDYSEREVGVGENVVDPKHFQNLKAALDLLVELNLPVDELKVENIDYREAVADLSSGPDMYFSFLFNPSFARDVVEKLKTSGEWNSLRYVDLRVENRAYYSQ